MHGGVPTDGCGAHGGIKAKGDIQFGSHPMPILGRELKIDQLAERQPIGADPQLACPLHLRKVLRQVELAVSGQLAAADHLRLHEITDVGGKGGAIDAVAVADFGFGILDFGLFVLYGIGI